MFCPYCGKKGVQNLEKCPECEKSLIGIDKESKNRCPTCKRFVPAGALVCWFCGQKLEGYIIGGKTGEEKTEKEEISVHDDKPYISPEKVVLPSTEFGTLLAYGKLIAGFGWFLVIVGIIAFLFIAISGKGSQESIFQGFVIGIIFAVGGFSYVIFGQAISCFVSIEKYTRQTAYLLNKFLSKKP